MRSRILSKSRHLLDSVTESILEWMEHLYRSIVRNYSKCSNLTETYTIRDSVSRSTYVQNFIKERARIIGMNHYRIAINIEHEYKCKYPNEIGKVTLHRKNRVIDEARLVTKENENEERKLIYWKFN